MREFLSIFNYKEGTQTIPFEKVEESKAKGNGSDFDCVTAPSSEKDLVGTMLTRSFVLLLARKYSSDFSALYRQSDEYFLLLKGMNFHYGKNQDAAD